MKGLLVILACAGAAAAQSQVEVVNNLPYPVRQPVGGVLVTAPASSHAVISLPQKPGEAALDASADGPGLRLRYQGTDMGRLTWGLLLQAAGPADHAAAFEPLALQFEPATRNAMFADWTASAERSGFAVGISARIWAGGFADWSVSLRNVSATALYGQYGAIVVRWERPEAVRHMLSYDNREEDFDASGKTRFGAGKDRHNALQHGLDWLALDFGNGAALVLNSFNQLSTVLDDTGSTRSRSPKFLGASLPQFKNEAVAARGALYLVGEFARDNRPYRDRFVENRLPDIGRTIRIDQRIAFAKTMPSRGEASNAFTAFNTWIGQTPSRIEIGVPGVVFGTSYFPYSTLGENFGDLKMPGQQTDAFWPFSADTVTHWKEFAPDIRRDLRIAKAMGFSVIRLHYIDVIAKLPEKLQFEYLDFLFSELRALKLRALFSTAFTYWTPEQIAARVGRYRDVIDRVEIENEILIWGIPLDRPQYWARVYAAVRQAAPGVRIHWTSHLNTGIFERLDDLHIPYDVVSAHAYIDALDAIPSGRGFALAAGNYASRKGKDAIYTEWNWRGLTRMTPEARARVYPAIMENLLATHSIRELYPFQFQQTMCVNPHTRKGIRQYEPIWLSRRPKPEAFELMKLIGQYSAPGTPARTIAASHPVLDLEGAAGELTVQVRNSAAATLRLKLSAESGEPLSAQVAESGLALAPGAERAVRIQVALPAAAAAGFYHVFLRMESDDGMLRYAWGEVRKPGQPRGLKFDANRPVAVVYGENCPVIELEAAYLLAATLESASGRPVALYSSQDVPAGEKRTVIAIGNAKQNPFAQPGKSALTLADYDATVAFVLPYWKEAKDSGVRRTGLVRKSIPAGADVANLP
jgi:hypothetical protein